MSDTEERESIEYELERQAINEKKEKKWKKTGKGKGLRWLLLRDLCAILSLRPMSLNLIQDTMLLHRGLKRSTVRDMIDQLERTKSIEQIQDSVTASMVYWVWISTEGGVRFWIGSRKDIPASIVQVATALKPVSVTGEF